MHKHLETAFVGYQQLGLDFSDYLRWHLAHGGVATSPKFVCVVRPVNHSHPSGYNIKEPDAVFIEFVSCDKGHWDFLFDWMHSLYPYDNIYFNRMFKGHKNIRGPFPMKRVHNLLKGTE